MILVITSPGDKLQAHVLPGLTARGASFVRLNTADFPTNVGLTFRYGPSQASSIAMSSDGRLTDLSEIETVWYRRPMPLVPHTELSAADQEFSLNESRHAVNGLMHTLRDRFWVNPYDASRAGEHKPYQLAVAKSVGFDIPRTLVTNRSEDVLDFFDQSTTGIVYKTLTHYARDEESTGANGVFTSRVDRGSLVGRLAQIPFAPCIFQDYVDKRIELRVTVIGDQIFAAEIDSQSSADSSLDWRRSILSAPAPHRASSLSPDVAVMVRDLMARMGLVFGCIDLIVTPDDRIVFLEINPNGQWYWIERATGMPLLAAFCDLLVSSA